MTEESRVVLVSGGGRGIGRAISLRLAADGFDVAVNYRRDKEAADETVAAITELGQRARAFQASVDSWEDDQAMVEAVVAHFARLDALVNNAGVTSRGGAVTDADLADLQRVLGIHAVGAFYLCKLVVPHLRRQTRGDIVMISSQATQTSDPYASPYNMAKAAEEALAFTLAKEEAKHGIRVNVVSSGLANTEMGRRLVKATLGADDIHQLDRHFGLGRVCEPDDVAGAVSYLLSDAAAAVTGQRLGVDAGGFSPVPS